MAQKVAIEYTCDTPRAGNKGTRCAGEPKEVRLTMDGQEYEIDLCIAHITPYETAVLKLLPFARKARPAPKAGRSAAVKTRAARHTVAAEIRAWAADHGHDVKVRGIIPSEVLTAYYGAHGQPVPEHHHRGTHTGPGKPAARASTNGGVKAAAPAEASSAPSGPVKAANPKATKAAANGEPATNGKAKAAKSAVPLVALAHA
jgi:hypothetical protein